MKGLEMNDGIARQIRNTERQMQALENSLTLMADHLLSKLGLLSLTTGPIDDLISSLEI
jgi:hypothetical protein